MNDTMDQTADHPVEASVNAPVSVGEQASTARCWVVSNGRPGTQNQALGLARALQRILLPQVTLSVQIKQIVVDRSLPAVLMGSLWSGAKNGGRTGALKRLSPKGHLLRPPFPDLWIAAGNDSVPVTMAVKQENPATFTIQTQDPRVSPDAFDLVIPPHHDAIRGPNVLTMIGAPTPITKEKVAHARAAHDAWFVGVPERHVTVLLGGSTKRQWMSPAQTDTLIGQLRGLCGQGLGVLISGSRRTDARILTLLREAFAAQLKTGTVRLIDGAETTATGFNPYPAILANPMAILVTEDSVNMVSEAAMTGHPVYMIALSGSAGKFRHFYRAMNARGITRPFTGTIEPWAYAPFDETGRVARSIAKTLEAKGVIDGVVPGGENGVEDI
ncbi:MAG: mitochondrial fission ELM1 family protein [Pseudomonadota bacterium]